MLIKRHSAICAYRVNVITVKDRNTLRLHRCHKVLAVVNV